MPSTWRFDLKIAKDLLRKGFPIMLTQAATMLYLRLDVVFLEYFSGASAVGIYSLAAKLCEPLSFLGIALIMAFSPVLIRSYKKIKESYWHKLGRLSAGLSSYTYVLIFFVFFFSKPFVSIVFGPEYSAVGAVWSILVLNIFFIFLGDLKETTLILEKQQIFYLFSITMALFASIALNLNLIPRYGVYGLVWAKVIVALFVDIVVLLFYPPTRRLAGVLARSFLIFPLFTERSANKP